MTRAFLDYYVLHLTWSIVSASIFSKYRTMWSDKETAEDLLGYTMHASLLRGVVTNDKNLPITVGLYGDWGSGKSSILKILEGQLNKDDDTVVVYFDGWSFESFDDAKMAIIQGIVDALEKNEKFIEKVKDKSEDLKDAFRKLRKSINWMRLLKLTATAAIPIATAATTGGASLIIPMLLSAFQEHKAELGDILTGEKAEQFLKDALKTGDEESAKYQAVREFRNDFEDLIKKSKQGRVVILIDDLDRCLPRHIIENLEAIKLFLNVPGTAFVIAADKYIVSNAIMSEYKEIITAAKEDRPRLGESYMEKFIQLPYNIPHLSPKEVETYVTLLLCQSLLTSKQFEKVRDDFASHIASNKFEIYGWTDVKSLLDTDAPDDLGRYVGFFSHFSSIIGNSLKWNPRLIKRFLNAYEIRSRLLEQSGIKDERSKFALLKLMLIEQKHLDQFKQLSTWVINCTEVPKELLVIEDFADRKTEDIGEFKDWNTSELLKIVSTEPKFSSIDMKELFWVSRDNLVEEMSGQSLISSNVRSLFNEVTNAASDTIRATLCKTKVAALQQGELDDFYSLLETKVLITPSEKDAYNTYYHCIMNDISGAYNKLLEVLGRIDTTKIPFSLGNKFKEILEKYNQDKKLENLISKNIRLMKTINGK